MATKRLPYKDNLDSNLDELFSKVDFRKQDNGRAGNHDAEIVMVNFPFSLMDISVKHKLGRVAEGYIVIGSNTATFIFDGVTAWDENTISLQSVVAGVTAKIIII
jgi:hypothetical protein